MDPLYDGLQIISSTLSYSQKQGISNSNFGEAVLDQVLATLSQCGVFAFGERYHKKVLSDDSLTPTQYFALTQEKKDPYDAKDRDLVASRRVSSYKTACPAVPVPTSRNNTMLIKLIIQTR